MNGKMSCPNCNKIIPIKSNICPKCKKAVKKTPGIPPMVKPVPISQTPGPPVLQPSIPPSSEILKQKGIKKTIMMVQSPFKKKNTRDSKIPQPPKINKTIPKPPKIDKTIPLETLEKSSLFDEGSKIISLEDDDVSELSFDSKIISILDEDIGKTRDDSSVEELDTADIELDDSSISELSPESDFEDEWETGKKPFWNRPLFPVSFARLIKTNKIPEIILRTVDKVTILHGIFGVICVLILFIIIALFSSGDENEIIVPSKDKVSIPVTKIPIRKKITIKKPADKKITPSKSSDMPKEDISIPETTIKCKPLKQYPGFLKSAELKKMVSLYGKNNLCHLFGISTSGILTNLNKIKPIETDLMVSGKIAKIPLKDKRKKREITLLFANDKLVELTVDFKDSLRKRTLLEGLKKTLSAGKEISKNSYSWQDDNLEILLTTHRGYNRKTWSKLTFSTSAVKETLKKEFEAKQKAQTEYDLGMKAYYKRKFKGAQNHFHKAALIIENYGMARVMQSFMLIREEGFEKIEKLADIVIKVSRSPKARAESFGLLAVCSLFNKDKNAAITYFKKAADENVFSARFLSFAKELETSNYKVANVAKTAARMGCREKKKKWSVAGLLARGNFPDKKTYENALRKAKKQRKYNREYRKWKKWECR